eukprot:8271887-Pyramimonas_sp.AAC.1
MPLRARCVAHLADNFELEVLTGEALLGLLLLEVHRRLPKVALLVEVDQKLAARFVVHNVDVSL